MDTTKEYRTMDKSDWGSGPWQDEPDRVAWTDEVTGYRCLAIRGRHGAWCGYVRLPLSHPLYGVVYYQPSRYLRRQLKGRLGKPTGTPPGLAALAAATKGVTCLELFDVHGGITFSGPRAEEPDAFEAGWWFGFDCAHAVDLVPAAYDHQRLAGVAYRDLAYVRGETQRLAAQLFFVSWPWYVRIVVIPWRLLKARIHRWIANRIRQREP